MLRSEIWKYIAAKEGLNEEKIQSLKQEISGINFIKTPKVKQFHTNLLTEKEDIRKERDKQYRIKNYCLSLNLKIQNLEYSYLLNQIHHERILRIDTEEESLDLAESETARFYHTEMFPYLFFSLIDVLHQVIREVYDIDIEVSSVGLNSVVRKYLKMSGSEIHKVMSNIEKNLQKFKDSRNSFTHKFNPIKDMQFQDPLAGIFMKKSDIEINSYEYEAYFLEMKVSIKLLRQLLNVVNLELPTEYVPVKHTEEWLSALQCKKEILKEIAENNKKIRRKKCNLEAL